MPIYMFGAKVLGAIDLSFFQLCDSCFRASLVHDVNYGKFCLANLRDDIENNLFHENMPAYLISSTKNKKEGDDGDLDDAAHRKKRFKDFKDPKDLSKKKYYIDLEDMVKNQQAVQDWLIPGGKYKTLFTRDVIATTPRSMIRGCAGFLLREM
jgi:hypothetical protein